MKVRRFFAALLVTLGIGAGFVAGRATADQPRMQAALEHLRQAKEELEHADRDKGGHREAALRFTNNAISEVEKGIRFDRRH